MKLNWGTSIAIFYGVFMIIMIFMVVRSSQNSVELVQDHYYDKDLNYEAFRQSRENSTKLLYPAEVTHAPGDPHVVVKFPDDKNNIEGKITLYRPSNRYEDQVMRIDLRADNSMKISTSKMRPGLWKVLIDWKSNGVSYYREETITI